MLRDADALAEAFDGASWIMAMIFFIHVESDLSFRSSIPSGFGFFWG